MMELALAQAHLARDQDEVPVGAVIVLDGEVIAQACNQNQALNDPSAHAEVLAIRAAAAHLQNQRLNGAKLYVTLEPCVMCAGAILHARIAEVIYAAADARWGAAGSVANVLDSPLLGHSSQVTAGVMKAPASALLRDYFASKRAGKEQE